MSDTTKARPRPGGAGVDGAGGAAGDGLRTASAGGAAAGARAVGAGAKGEPRYEFFATCSKGLESVLAYELKSICACANATAGADAGGSGDTSRFATGRAAAASGGDVAAASGSTANAMNGRAVAASAKDASRGAVAAKAAARELKALRIRPLSSGVAFFATLEQAYRALLGLFTASRVLLVLARVDASDADTLYKQVYALPWEEHLSATGTLAVDAHGVNDALRDTRFVAQKVKDAVCDRLLRLQGVRPSVQRNRPGLQINISLRGNRATVALDLAGEPLHRRGYRVPSAAISAPLRETLAAAMLIIGGWYDGETAAVESGAASTAPQSAPPMAGQAAHPQRYLLDPLCGSGTIAIEAALMAAQYAPGLQRDYWGFQGWLGHDPELWDRLLDAADDAAQLGGERLRRQQPLIYASDIDAKAVAVARESAKRAGVAGFIEFAVGDVAGLELSDWRRLAPGLLVCNPPYGERMFSSSQLPSLYAALARLRQYGTAQAGAGAGNSGDPDAAMSRPAVAPNTVGVASTGGICAVGEIATLEAYHAAEMPAVLITPDVRVDAYFGEATRFIKTFNGPIETTIRTWQPEPLATSATPPPPAAADMPQPGHCEPSSDGAAIHLPSSGNAATASAATAPAADAAMPSTSPQSQEESGQFENRLRKMAAHRGKWARRAGVSCYRVYDADLPDYAVAIDLYQGAEGSADAGQRWLHIAEYKPPAEIDERRATERLAVVLRLAPKLLDVPLTNVFLKQRERSKGGGQYGLLDAADSAGNKTASKTVNTTNQKPGDKAQQTGGKAQQANAKSAAPRKGRPMAASPGCHLITEEGLLFEVEFTRLLDTGIFLDHRLTRSMLRQRAAGLDCLNLFAYTGTASVHMAAGHARSVTTLDLSNNYINWAQRNMQLNGFIGQNYDYQQADALRWVEEHRHDSQKYGLIFADPPTFSNSARMGRRSFDVQRDHAELVIALTRMLAQDGTVIFSCNLRGFKLDLPTLEKAKVGVTDISARTIPQDFERNQRIHHCFLATRLR